MNLDKVILQGKGVFVFSDPAGANSVFAIIDFLISLNKIYERDFLIFTNKIGVFEEKYSDIVERIDFRDETCINVQKTFNPDYIFSATSNNNFEHLWRKFFSEKIKIYSFIDHWCNYFKRFHFDNEVVFGNVIFVINEIAKEEAIKEGVPEEVLRILENPYYEKVRGFKPSVRKLEFLKLNKLSETKSKVLFISDYISTNHKKDKNGNCELGYDEYTVLSDLLVCFNSIESTLISTLQLVIKIHPKAPLNKFESLINNFNITDLDIIIIRDCKALEINYYSDYVIGMFSNMVIESYLLNKKLLRVQTGQLGQDLIKLEPIMNDVIIDKSELYFRLNKFLRNVG